MSGSGSNYVIIKMAATDYDVMEMSATDYAFNNQNGRH